MISVKRALEWFLQAAEGGDKAAQLQIGLHCLRVATRLEHDHDVGATSSDKLAGTLDLESCASCSRKARLMETSTDFWAAHSEEVESAQQLALETSQRHRRPPSESVNAHLASVAREDLDDEQTKWYATASVWLTKGADNDYWSIPWLPFGEATKGAGEVQQAGRPQEAIENPAVNLHGHGKKQCKPKQRRERRFVCKAAKNEGIEGGGSSGSSLRRYYQMEEDRARVRCMRELGCLAASGNIGPFSDSDAYQFIDPISAVGWWHAAAEGLPSRTKGGRHFPGDTSAQRLLRNFHPQKAERVKARRAQRPDVYHQPRLWIFEKPDEEEEEEG